MVILIRVCPNNVVNMMTELMFACVTMCLARRRFTGYNYYLHTTFYSSLVATRSLVKITIIKNGKGNSEFCFPRPSENRLLKGSNSYLKKRRLETVLLLYFILASRKVTIDFFSFSKMGAVLLWEREHFIGAVGRSVGQPVSCEYSYTYTDWRHGCIVA